MENSLPADRPATETPPLGQTGVISITNSIRGRFFLRLALWLVCYLGITIAWGERNAWPIEIVAPLLSLPIAFAISRHVYRTQQITLETRPAESQWTLLICFLLLAVGLASGLMLLMAIGWVSLGVAWLRPADPRVPWDEWFKLPLLFILTLPVISDLAGSRFEWLGRSGNPEGAVQHFLLNQLALRAVLFTVVVKFSGPTFWGGLVTFPVAFLLGQVVSRAIAGSPRAWWIVAAIVLIVLVVWRQIRQVPSVQRETWREFTAGILGRSQSPWLAALVITLQQSALLERWLAGSQPKLELIGLAILLVILGRLRWQAPPTSLHIFSQILLAGALFVLLAAEWTDLNVLRQISLGLLVISALSWRRAWSLWVLVLAVACWISALPAAAAALSLLGFPADVAAQMRVFVMALGLASTAIVSFVHPATRSRKQYSDAGWMPVKRFALILLLLLATFQIASVYLPGTQPPTPVRLSSGFTPMVTSSRELLFFRAASAERWQLRIGHSPADLFIATPLHEPLQLQSPELVLQNSGWHISHRRLLPNARGQVVELQLEKAGRHATALCWYQFGGQTFTHYLRARNILWSGWNLHHRELRLILLLAEGANTGPDLVELAESKDWFFTPVPDSPVL
jgi:hypothetical protein